MRGRPKTPTAAKVTAGTYREDRDGPLSAQVRAEGVPEPPPTLGEAARASWDELVPRLVAAGIACKLDETALELLCVWHASLRAIQGELNKIQPAELAGGRGAQVLGLLSMATKGFDKFACRFGMTPADRAKVRVAPPAGPRRAVPPWKKRHDAPQA